MSNFFISDEEIDELGAALLQCIPAITGYPAGSIAEAAVADQAAGEWLKPVVERIIARYIQ